jgi:beta-galactosidase
LPDDIDVLSPHYGNAKNLENYAHEVKRPIIATEYAHALGLDMDKVETMWEAMYTHPQIAGGAVWMFFDQGILRTSKTKVDKNAYTYSAWPDSVHYYDMAGNKGCDGLVYANRIPQVDYFEVRKVYAPVKAINDSITIKPGTQKINIKINNRFDFKDLSDLKCKWTLTADNKPLQSGALLLKCNPHDTISLPVSITLPDKLTAVNYLLDLKFYDQSGYQFTEKTYRLWYKKNQVIDNKDLVARTSDKYVLKDNGNSVSAGSIFTLDKKSGDVKIQNPITKQTLLEGPFARVGRKTTMSTIATFEKNSPKGSGNNNWDPAVLRSPVASVDAVSASLVKCNYKYERSDKKSQFIDGAIQFTLSGNGCINVNYNFKPENATGYFLEAGISFNVPAEYTEMRWIGDGPYASYPGKSMLDEYGFFHLNYEDLYFQGNRSNVQLMLFTDKNGNGFAINCDNADICVERTPEGLLLSHNALVSGRFNKGTMPDLIYDASKVNEIKGGFSIIPVNSNMVPELLMKMFGNLSARAVPFKPFYHSYDE